MTERRPLRADSRRTVDRILDAATRTLGAEPGAPMERVADASAVHRATLYRYFPTREALIEHIADRAIDDARQVVATAAALPSGRPAFARLTADTVAFGDRYAFLIGSDAITAAGPDPIGLAALMRRWQDDGLLRAGVAPQWLASAFIALAAALYALPDTGEDARAALLEETFLTGAAQRA